MEELFKQEINKLIECIEDNTEEHWREYYKGVPVDCIYRDLVIDINEIKRLKEENKKLKEELKKR